MERIIQKDPNKRKIDDHSLVTQKIRHYLLMGPIQGAEEHLMDQGGP